MFLHVKTCIYVIVHVHVHVVMYSCTISNVQCTMSNVQYLYPGGKVREIARDARLRRGNPRNCAITRKIALFRARIRVPAKGRDKTKSRGISRDKHLTLPLP